MKAGKRRKLEAAGWRVGSADDFLDQTMKKSPKLKLPSLQKLMLQHYVYGDERGAWLVVRDLYAGRKNVYTVYRIALAGDKAVKVIGHELDLPLARKIVRQDMGASR